MATAAAKRIRSPPEQHGPPRAHPPSTAPQGRSARGSEPCGSRLRGASKMSAGFRRRGAPGPQGSRPRSAPTQQAPSGRPAPKRSSERRAPRPPPSPPALASAPSARPRAAPRAAARTGPSYCPRSRRRPRAARSNPGPAGRRRRAAAAASPAARQEQRERQRSPPDEARGLRGPAACSRPRRRRARSRRPARRRPTPRRGGTTWRGWRPRASLPRTARPAPRRPAPDGAPSGATFTGTARHGTALSAHRSRQAAPSALCGAGRSCLVQPMSARLRGDGPVGRRKRRSLTVGHGVPLNNCIWVPQHRTSLHNVPCFNHRFLCAGFLLLSGSRRKTNCHFCCPIDTFITCALVSVSLLGPTP